ncbi:MAG: sensor histidine kinase [Ktedonobacteraceae bacterium]
MTEIEEIERLKARFISMITHELRSPINTINGYLDLALEGIAGELNEQQREFVRRARAGSEHLYTLIEDLLLITRADAGQLRLNRELIRLPEIIDQAVEELELVAMDNDVTIRVEITSDFPQIYADAIRMHHVMRNLLNNALRFTPQGGDIAISARVNGTPAETTISGAQQHVEIHIRDAGCGIAPEYQQRIFERFYQIPIDRSGRAGGQGLGLTAAKMILELHGGQISVESIPGKGSNFTLTFPLLKDKNKAICP